MIKKIKAGIAKVAAIGAVKRKGIGALQSYPGRVSGEGYVIRNSGPDKGKKIKFTIDGHVGAEN